MFWCINLTTYLRRNFSSQLADQGQVEPAFGIEKLEEDYVNRKLLHFKGLETNVDPRHDKMPFTKK